MKNNREIVILRAYRPFLTFLTMYKLDNFRHNVDRRILMRNICRATGVTLLLAIYLCPFLSSELIVFIESKFDLNASGVRFSYFVGGAPTMSVHLLLIWKCNKIIETLDYLRGIVMDRKCFSCLCVRIYDNLIEKSGTLALFRVQNITTAIG